MVSRQRATNSVEYTRFRLRDKFSLDGLRQQFLSPFRPVTSPSVGRTSTLVSLPERPQTSPQVAPECFAGDENEPLTLLEGLKMAVPADQRASSTAYLRPETRDFAYQHSLSDSASHYDATGEPLVNDAASDYIPRSARPLIEDTIDCEACQGSNSPSAHRFSKLDLDYDPPRTPESTHFRADSAQSKTENYHRRREESIEDSVDTSVTNSPRETSSVGSARSTHSSATAHSSHGLPPLQARSVLEEGDRLDPVLEDDPACFDLVEPSTTDANGFSLEKRVGEMLSHGHLKEIFADPSSMLKFTSFLSQHRPKSIPLLIHYLDALKSLKAIKYANAIAEALSPISSLGFTELAVDKTINSSLEKRADEAFNVLVREDLPAYIAYVFIQVVNLSLRHRVSGKMPNHLREASEGLAEVFCLTDPSRSDNPIVFASEEFHRTSQYGVDYAIGRNCRFLQGPQTNKDAVRRLKEATTAGRECVEVFLNYRRDGSPFMNLLMVAPLVDSRGNTRYFIGAQVDVSGLCKDCTDLEALRRYIEKQNAPKTESTEAEASEDANDETQLSRHRRIASVDEFQELSEMFNDNELSVVRSHGGRMLPKRAEDGDETVVPNRPRLHVRDPSSESKEAREDDDTPAYYATPTRGRLLHVYQNYLLVRPYPSLRILFASPALRTPGMLQSPFLSRIGGSPRVRDELKAALDSGRGVTAKVRWVSGRPGDEDGRTRWVHCTPLLGKNGSVGVWMIIIIDEDGYVPVRRGFKAAPPVIGIDAMRESRASSLWGDGSDDQSLRASV